MTPRKIKPNVNGKVSVDLLLICCKWKIYDYISMLFICADLVRRCAQKVLITVAFSACVTAEGCFRHVPSLAVLRQSPLLLSTNTHSLSVFELDSLTVYCCYGLKITFLVQMPTCCRTRPEKSPNWTSSFPKSIM